MTRRARSNTTPPGSRDDRDKVPYRKIEFGTWTDDKFMALSRAQPNGQTLWLYLLTGPRTTPFPGLIVAREAVMADDLGWPLEGFREAFGEAFGEGLVDADWKAGVVVLRKALLTGSGRVREIARPASPNHLRGWSKFLYLVPDCRLKTEYLRTLEAFAEGLGEAFHQAFREAFGDALVKPSRNQYQESVTGNRRDPADPLQSAITPPSGADSADPEPGRPHALAPEPEQQNGRPSLAVAKVDDPATLRRQRLRVKTFDALGVLRVQLATDLGIVGVRPLHPHDPGERELSQRIGESGTDAEANCDHVLAVAEAEARGSRSVKWLTGGIFSAQNWRRMLGTTPREAFADADAKWRREHPDEVAAERSESTLVLPAPDGEWDPFEERKRELAAAAAKKGTGA